MSVKEKLVQEFNAAIIAIYGDQADNEYQEDTVTESELIAIAKKVAFYIDAK